MPEPKGQPWPLSFTHDIQSIPWSYYFSLQKRPGRSNSLHPHHSLVQAPSSLYLPVLLPCPGTIISHTISTSLAPSRSFGTLWSEDSCSDLRAFHYPRIMYKDPGIISKAHYHLASISFSLASSLITAPAHHVLQPRCFTKASHKAFAFSHLRAFVHSVPSAWCPPLHRPFLWLPSAHLSYLQNVDIISSWKSPQLLKLISAPKESAHGNSSAMVLLTWPCLSTPAQTISSFYNRVYHAHYCTQLLAQRISSIVNEGMNESWVN